MKIEELPAFLENELTYSLTHASVLAQIGAVEIEAPDTAETETISDIIDSVGQSSYDSADELYATVIGNVSDEYIGRKFYDNRGDNPADTPAGPRDEMDISF